MACPSDITITIHHKCTSTEIECAKEDTKQFKLTELLSLVSDIATDNMCGDNVDDFVNEAIHTLMGI